LLIISDTCRLDKLFAIVIFYGETFVFVGALNQSMIQKFQFTQRLCNVVAETDRQLSIDRSIL